MIPRWLFILHLRVFAAVVFPVICGASPAAPLPIDAILQQETVLSAAFSSDAQWIAMIVMRIGDDSDAAAPAPARVTRNTLRIMQLATGKWWQPAPSGTQSNVFAWSPSGTILAFDVQNSAGYRLWTWHAGSATAQALDTLELRSSNLIWSQNSKALIAAAVPPGITSAQLENAARVSNEIDTSAQSIQVAASGPSITLYRSQPTTASSQPIQDYAFNHRFRAGLARIELRNRAISWLTQDARLQNLRSSPDGHWIAYTSLTGQAGGNGYRNLFELWVVPTAGNAPPRLLAPSIENIGTALDFSWAPDSTRLAFMASSLRKDGNPRTNNTCHWLALTNTSLQSIRLPETGIEPGSAAALNRSPLWSADGHFLYLIGSGDIWRANLRTSTAAKFASIPQKRIRHFVAPRSSDALGRWAPSRSMIVIAQDLSTKTEAFHRINLLSGQAHSLFEAAARFSTSAATLDVSRDGRRLLYSRESAENSAQLWMADPALHSQRQITQLNPALSAQALGHTVLISWNSLTGKPLKGSVLLPSEYRTGHRYPLIVQLYGEDILSDGLNRFGGANGQTLPYYNGQLLATRGFAVLEPDSHANPGTLLPDAAASILPGIDKAIDMGVADPDRLGLRGQSAGGYQALALLVQTHRFKAAIVSAGFADLFGMYTQMHADGTHWAMSWVEDAGRMGTTPWNALDRYMTNSPFFVLNRISTPLLLIHGAEDTAVQPQLADAVFVSLRRLGKEVEYAKYAHEGHVLLRHVNAKDAAERSVEWFERHLRTDIRDPGSSSR